MPQTETMSDFAQPHIKPLGLNETLFTLAPEGLGNAPSALGRTRLRTFIALRWLAIAGQTAAVLLV